MVWGRKWGGLRGPGGHSAREGPGEAGPCGIEKGLAYHSKESVGHPTGIRKFGKP